MIAIYLLVNSSRRFHGNKILCAFICSKLLNIVCYLYSQWVLLDLKISFLFSFPKDFMSITPSSGVTKRQWGPLKLVECYCGEILQQIDFSLMSYWGFFALMSNAFCKFQVQWSWAFYCWLLKWVSLGTCALQYVFYFIF